MPLFAVLAVPPNVLIMLLYSVALNLPVREIPHVLMVMSEEVPKQVPLNTRT